MNAADFDDSIEQPNELDILKQRARLMGLTFSNNIGLESLKEKINAHTEKETPASEDESKDDGNEVVVEELVEQKAPAKQKKQSLRKHLMEKSMKLIRLRITNLDPKKKDLPGEFLTVANEYIGTVTKYIPFGTATDDGYHVPYCIYKFMKSKKFLSIRSYTVKGQIQIEQRWANEFALEVLEPLTPDQLKKLAAAQLAAGNQD